MSTTATPTEQRQYLRPKRVALEYGISTSLVYRAIERGDLPAQRFKGRIWLIRPSDAEAWIAAESEPNRQAVA